MWEVTEKGPLAVRDLHLEFEKLCKVYPEASAEISLRPFAGRGRAFG